MVAQGGAAAAGGAMGGTGVSNNYRDGSVGTTNRKLIIVRWCLMVRVVITAGQPELIKWITGGWCWWYKRLARNNGTSNGYAAVANTGGGGGGGSASVSNSASTGGAGGAGGKGIVIIRYEDTGFSMQ